MTITEHARVCRYVKDERYGLDVDACIRCRRLRELAGPRPGSEPSPTPVEPAAQQRTDTETP